MKKSSLLSDMMTGLCIILTGYFYYYSNNKIVHNIEDPAMVNYAIKLAIGAIIVIVWFVLCIQNGTKKRYSFLIFTLLIWIIPQISKHFVEKIDLSAITNTTQMSSILFVKYVSNINYLSLKIFGDLIYDNFNIPYLVTLNCLIICFVIMFVIGIIIDEYYNTGDRSNEKHTKTSEDTPAVN